MTRRARRVMAAGAGAAAGLTVGIGASVYLLHRSRRAADPGRALDLEERPGEQFAVTSFDGTDLAVNAVGPEGGGPTLIFVHGFTLDMTAWHFQWKCFSHDHRCVLFDQRGHGRSGPAAGGDYSLEALGRDLKAVLDAVAPDQPVVLIGHSLGGMAVLSFANLHPEEFGSRVGGVVLANTSAGDLLKAMLGALGSRAGTYLAPWAHRLSGNPARLHRLRQGLFHGGAGLAFLAARATNFGVDAPPSVVEHVVRLASRAPAEVWTDIFTSLVELDLGHALRHVTVPALIVAGDVDRLTPPSSALALQGALPDARMVVLTGAGHCSILERHEQFNDAVADFLRDLGGASAPHEGSVLRGSGSVRR
ncbi:MAG: alpha/beta hydrolase [Actinobacteria bacterium]|nr:alpha/beta hydrolase [Actinomycetota bacterium]